jgi:hypothetical protein
MLNHLGRMKPMCDCRTMLVLRLTRDMCGLLVANASAYCGGQEGSKGSQNAPPQDTLQTRPCQRAEGDHRKGMIMAGLARV